MDEKKFFLSLFRINANQEKQLRNLLQNGRMQKGTRCKSVGYETKKLQIPQ